MCECGVFKILYIFDQVIYRGKLTSKFMIYTYFIYFSCLITLARIFSTVLTRRRESGHFCLPDLRGRAFVRSVFSIYAFPSISNVLRVFIIKKCLTLSHALSVSVEIITWSLFCHLTSLHMLNHHCIPGIKPFWFFCVAGRARLLATSDEIVVLLLNAQVHVTSSRLLGWSAEGRAKY